MIRLPVWFKLPAWPKRRYVAVGVSAVSLVILVVVLGQPRSAKRGEDDWKPRKAEAKMGDVVDILRVRGSVIAAKNVPIVSEATGQVVKLHVDEGEMVQKGDLLLEIDPTQILNSISKQKLTTEKASVSLKNVEDDFQKKDSLLKEHLIPQIEFNDAKKALDLARLDYEMAKKELDTLNYQLSKVKVTAPISGVITKKFVEEGEVIGSVGQSTVSKVLFNLVDVVDKKIELTVNDLERNTLTPGKKVEFWLDSDPLRRYAGEVVKVGAAATTAQGQGETTPGQFRVEVSFPTQETNVPLGVGVNVEAIVKEARGVVTVPVEAVFNEEGKSFVYLATRFGSKQRDVRTGISNIDLIEIREGLKPGDTVFLDEPTP